MDASTLEPARQPAELLAEQLRGAEMNELLFNFYRWLHRKAVNAAAYRTQLTRHICRDCGRVICPGEEVSRQVNGVTVYFHNYRCSREAVRCR